MLKLIRSRLFVRYVFSITVIVGAALLFNTLAEVYFINRSHAELTKTVQHDAALAASERISTFLTRVQSELAWTTHVPWIGDTFEQKKFDAHRLLRQVPAITELAYIDPSGNERLRVSKLFPDIENSGTDFSSRDTFARAVSEKRFFGPVYFRRDTEPYLSVSVRGASAASGVSIAEVNLTHIWDLVSNIRFGNAGIAFVIDEQGRLIAHPDISLVLKNAPAQDVIGNLSSAQPVFFRKDLQGREMMSASVPVPPVGWKLILEVPAEEAFAPLYNALTRIAFIFIAALSLAIGAGIVLARGLVEPIQSLKRSAVLIGQGNLTYRVSVHTGDEIESLAEHMNDMAGRLESLYATLEEKVRSRTSELQEIVRELQALRDVTSDVNSSLSKETVLSSIVRKAVEVSLSDDGELYLLDSPNNQYIARFGPGLTFDAAKLFEVTHCQSRWGEGKPGPVELDAGDGACLAVPLEVGTKLIGALVVLRRGGRYSTSTINLVRALAAQSVQAIVNSQLYDELGAKTLQLADANRHKTHFLENTSHELRTPLHAILGYTNLMLDGLYGALPQECLAVLTRVHVNGRHLLGLIDDVLDITKIESGQLQLSKSEFSFSQLINTVRVSIEPLAIQKGLSLECDVQTDIPLGFGDEMRLTQVILNLAGNAVKFTEHGVIEIRAFSDDRMVSVSVKDTGPGVRESEHTIIFERFRQGSASSAMSSRGAGLGLAISREIARMHGGDIILRSVAGCGSTFVMTIPAAGR